MLNQTRLDEIVSNAREVLAQELKAWLDPNEKKNQAKLVKGLFSLRNYGGGRMLIGFEDGSGKPLPPPEGFDPEKEYEQDKIQSLISRHASKEFEIQIGFGVIEGVSYPVLQVPSDILYPVAVKRGINDPDDNKVELVKKNDVYVRTLSSGGVPSSAIAQYSDWEAIVKCCFENREADIGSFIRRQISSVEASDLINALDQLRPSPKGSNAFETTVGGALSEAREGASDKLCRAKDFLLKVAQRAQARLSEDDELPAHGAMEVSAVVDGHSNEEHYADENFLRLLNNSNPRYSGWPFWVTLTGAPDQENRPYHYEGGYESRLVSRSNWMGMHIDFWRAEPSGCFYHLRALQDDMMSQNAPEPGSFLDFSIAILRVAEAMLVAMAYAKAMKYDPSSTNIEFAFRWVGLEGRQLSSWANPQRIMMPGRFSRQDSVESVVEVSLEVPASALSPYIIKVVRPLFAAFDGFVISDKVVEDLTNELVSRAF